MHAMRLLALSLALLATTAARAQQPAHSPPPPPSSSGDMSFDLFGDKEKKSPLDVAREQDRVAKLEQKVKLRRSLLKWHQVLGFATLGALAVTDVIGTFAYVDKYGSGNDTGSFLTAHLGLGVGTSALFATTGILALAAPNPYPKPLKLDAALVHKVAMALATACFVAQLVLGPITGTREGKLDQRDFAVAHLVIGYGAFAFMTAGVLAYVF
ncbi:MAG: hypothetical protein JWN44_418 [Myxococcales bacterium]|nr:hypothetical protein [Myxococcales bacterium]